MANHDKENEPEWIKRVKSEGAVPYMDLKNSSNCWATPPARNFMVRGPDYFSTKVKVPASDFLLRPLGFDWIKGPKKISSLLNNPKHRIRMALHDEIPNELDPFIWAFNFQLPTKENHSIVAYFVGLQPPKGSLMDRYLKGEDAFRNKRLKLIVNIVKGPWVVRKAVGDQAICIIGRALTCNYSASDDFMEVDIDVGSSVVASAIVHLSFDYFQTITADLAFVIESQDETELPERILGAVRFAGLKTDSARPVSEMRCEGNMRKLQHSFSSKLWRPFGSGFSPIARTDTQDDSSCSS